MPAPVLYRKWRPQTLAQVVGQEHVTRTLLNALAAGKLSHAYLFTGPRGTGKTSTARILAKAINCLTTGGKGDPCDTCPMCVSISEGRAMDIIEIDAASNRGIDDIRELRDRIGFAPAEARQKVYIIDEVHMLSDPAFNALLKTLEEPPPHAVFVLATTEVQRVPATILSRCQRFDFRRIPQHALTEHLAHICQSEGLEYEDAALELVARSAAGGARDAVSLLEQIEVAYGGRVMLADTQVVLGITGDPRAVELIRSVAQNDLTTGMQLIQGVREDGVGLPQFGKEVTGHLRNLMLIKADAGEAVELPPELASELRTLARTMPMDTITRALKIFGALDFRSDAASSLPLELAVVDCVLAQAAPATAPAPATPVAPAPAPARPPQPAAEAARPSPDRTTGQPPATSRPAPAAARSMEPAAPRPAAATPEPVAAARNAPAPGGGDPVEQMREVIRQVQLPKVRFIEALLRSQHCTVERVEANNVTIGFRAALKVHKDRVEQDANMRMIEQGIKQLTGVDYRVRIVLVENGAAGPGGGGEPPKGHLVRAALDAGARRVPPEA